MAADTVIPDTYNGQSYNRYTYVENGPLSFDDPTGHGMGYMPPSSLSDLQGGTDEWPSGGGVSEIYETRWDFLANSTQDASSGQGNSTSGQKNNNQTPPATQQPIANNPYMGLPPAGSTVLRETPDSRARLLLNPDGSFSV
jgi:hypothetical protein